MLKSRISNMKWFEHCEGSFENPPVHIWFDVEFTKRSICTLCNLEKWSSNTIHPANTYKESDK